MDFVKYISTPPDNTKSNPLITTLKLTKGRLTGGFLYFPSGPAGVLHFLARMGIHQILPFNTGQNFRLDDCVVPFSLGIDLLEPPFEVDCITWNDSTLEHTHALTVCFALEPPGEKHDLKSLIRELRNG
jgi:hypothetical protein